MKSPFKFLDSYTREDRGIFFGRDQEITELYRRVFEGRMLLVYGISGTGKSSLVNCGLASRFDESDWLPVNVRRGNNIIDSLNDAFGKQALTPLKKNQSVSEKLQSIYLDHFKPVYLLFDQFEELFIFGSQEEKEGFISIVKEITVSEVQCRIIFIIREEFLAGMTEFESELPDIFINRFRVEKMKRTNAISAVEGPCKVFGIETEQGFSEELIDKLCPAGNEIELTYLQIYLDRIFRLSINEQPGTRNAEPGTFNIIFSKALLTKAGSVSDLLGQFLDEQIREFEDPEKGLAILKSFVSVQGTKKQMTEHEIHEAIKSFGTEITEPDLLKYLEKFVELRMLRERDEAGNYELRHDALAEKVYEKFSTAEKELLEIRQFIKNSYQAYLKRKILLNNDDLIYISDKDSFLNLNPGLKGFVDESRKLQKVKLRTVKRLTAISVISFIILICIPIYYLLNSIKQTKVDHQAIRSISQVSGPIQRLRLAAEAWHKGPQALPKEALLKAFNNILEYKGKDSIMTDLALKYKIVFDPAPVDIHHAECSKDNKYVIGYSDSLVFIWKLDGKLEKIFRIEHYPLIDIKMSDDSYYIGGVSSDSILAIWDRTGGLQCTVKVPYNELNTRQIFKFTHKNDIIALSFEHDAVLLNPSGSILQTFDLQKSFVNAVDISPDNNFIATATADTAINVWYLNSVKGNYDFYNSIRWHKDTVLSVSFAANNIFIISSSKDKRNNRIQVGNINGRIFNKYDPRDDVCYAEFTSSCNGFVYICYSYNKRKSIKHFNGINYKNPVQHVPNIRGGLTGFLSLEFSEDDNYFTYSKNNKVYLTDNILALERDWFRILSTFNLLEFNGTNPFFTKDENYLLFIDGHSIKSCFINTDTISGIAQRIAK